MNKSLLVYFLLLLFSPSCFSIDDALLKPDKTIPVNMDLNKAKCPDGKCINLGEVDYDFANKIDFQIHKNPNKTSKSINYSQDSNAENTDIKNSNSKLLKIKEEFLQAYSLHQIEIMKINEDAYKTQHWMTIVIFFIVSFLVLGGFYLSYLQFKSDTIREIDSAGDAKTSIELSKSGIKFSSSVIGLVVLFMSFMFFYLYVKEVYTIKIHPIAPVITPDKQNTDTKK